MKAVPPKNTPPAPLAQDGRVSGIGWGVGYAGGLACLVVALFGLVRADPPPFGLDAAAAEPVRATVLLGGESGVGKDMIARAIHYHSPRKDRPFVKINCTAIPENLKDSIFGGAKIVFDSS